MQSVLKLSKLTKSFGNRRAVDTLSFELPEEAFLSIFGPNGAGKTTLLRILATLIHASSGSAQVCGLDIKEQPDKIRKRIGFISHNSMLYPDLSAEENLMFAAELYGVVDPAKRTREMLDAVGLRHRSLDAVRSFSRGMTQRLSIARALIHDPDLVFLDEPYSGLDPHAVDVFDELLAQVRERRSFVMVSHDLAKGYAMCTHALVLAKGKSVVFDKKENLDETQFKNLYLNTVGQGVA